MNKVRKMLLKNYYLLFITLLTTLCSGDQLKSIDAISKLVRTITFKSPCAIDPEVFPMGKSFAKLTNGNFLIQISSNNVALFNPEGKFIKYTTISENEKDFPLVSSLSTFPNGFIVNDGLMSKKAYIYNIEGKLTKSILFPVLGMHAFSAEKYKNYLFLGGFGYEYELFSKKVRRTILFSRLNCSNYSIDILLSRNKKESQLLVDEMHASLVDGFFFSINEDNGKIAGLCPLTPYVWIFDANSGQILRVFKFIPKYYKKIVPESPYGDDYDAWLSNWTYSNVPYWLNNETVLVNRGYKNSHFIDLYKINDVKDTAKSYAINKKFPVVYAENNLIYLISKIYGNTMTLEIRKFRK